MIIVIEGLDQAGKSTQSQLLSKYLTKNKIKNKVIDFPNYKTPIGKEIKRILYSKQSFIPQTLHCLLAANRWESLETIQKFLNKDFVLVMNRYVESNLVYGKTNNLSLKWLENLDLGLPKSDLVIVLDLHPKKSKIRKKVNRDVFEKNYHFAKSVSDNYRKLAKKYKWKLIKGDRLIDDVHKDVKKLVSRKLKIKNEK